MKNILLISTGGTIASKPTDSGLTPQLSSSQLLEFVPEISGICNFSGIQLFSLDSTNITPHHWVKIAETIRTNYDDFDGFVITHGTDTLSYTAAALSYMIQNCRKPVVLTGSQKSIYLRDTDARRNLIDAFTYASDEHAQGIKIVFNGNVILGTRARKTRTQSYNAFDSIDYPVVASVQRGRVLHYILWPKPAGKPKFAFNLNPGILVLKLTPGMNGDTIKKLGHHYRAIIIEAFGVGGLPNLGENSLRAAADEYTSEGGLIAITTQVPYEGSALCTYQVGNELCNNPNVLEGGNMTMEALTCKLIWILGQTDNNDEIQKLFYTPVDCDIL